MVIDVGIRGRDGKGALAEAVEVEGGTQEVARRKEEPRGRKGL